MKLLILIPLTLTLLSCVDKKQSENNAATIEPEKIIELEKENEEIQTLEMDINKDIEELDKLLNDLEN